MITSGQNAQIKRAVRLRQHKTRLHERAFIIEGYREVSKALRSDLIFDTTFVCEEFSSIETIEFLSRSKGSLGIIRPTDADVFRKISFRENPDGILAIAKMPDWDLNRLKVPDEGLYVVASGIEKPGNFGAILRTADAAGVDGVIVCEPRTDIFNHHVIRSSMGSLFHVPVAVTNRKRAIGWLNDQNIEIIVTTPGAQTLYTSIDLRKKVAIVVGNEADGLDDIWLTIGKAIRIPMAGDADSLNVGISAAVMLFEARRQRDIVQV